MCGLKLVNERFQYRWMPRRYLRQTHHDCERQLTARAPRISTQTLLVVALRCNTEWGIVQSRVERVVSLWRKLLSCNQASSTRPAGATVHSAKTYRDNERAWDLPFLE